MSFRESDFSGQSISPALAEAKDMPALEIARPGFAMYFAQGCRYVMQRADEKVLAVGFERFVNTGRSKPAVAGDYGSGPTLPAAIRRSVDAASQRGGECRNTQ